MTVASDWIQFEQQIPSGIVGNDDGGFLVAFRRGPAVDAREVGGTEVKAYDSNGEPGRTFLLPDVALIHGMVEVDDKLWVTDRGSHTVQIYDREGHQFLTIGNPDYPSTTGATEHIGPVPHPSGPFNGPTKAVPDGDEIVVSDGYGNARIHRFAADGTLLRTWGEYGSRIGQFRLPHAVEILPDGRTLVCDRENSRIQAFDATGSALGVWWEVHRPTDIQVVGDAVYVCDLSGRVTRLTHDAQPTATWTVPNSAHNLYIDGHGTIYVTHILRRSISRIREECDE